MYILLLMTKNVSDADFAREHAILGKAQNIIKHEKHTRQQLRMMMKLW